MIEIFSTIPLIVAQNEAQKNETFILLAVFALIACGLIAGYFAKTPYTKEKKVMIPMLIIAIMMLFVFFVVYLIMKYNN